MSATTRFLEADAIHQRIPGCPLAARPPETDQRACGACPYNLLYPGLAHVGCSATTPAEVFARGRAALKARAAELHRELEALRAAPGAVTGAPDAALAERWLALAEAWWALLEPAPADDAEREVASVAARFARAALELGEPVEILR